MHHRLGITTRALIVMALLHGGSTCASIIVGDLETKGATIVSGNSCEENEQERDSEVYRPRTSDAMTDTSPVGGPTFATGAIAASQGCWLNDALVSRMASYANLKLPEPPIEILPKPPRN